MKVDRIVKSIVPDRKLVVRYWSFWKISLKL